MRSPRDQPGGSTSSGLVLDDVAVPFTAAYPPSRTLGGARRHRLAGEPVRTAVAGTAGLPQRATPVTRASQSASLQQDRRQHRRHGAPQLRTGSPGSTVDTAAGGTATASAGSRLPKIRGGRQSRRSRPRIGPPRRSRSAHRHGTDPAVVRQVVDPPHVLRARLRRIGDRADDLVVRPTTAPLPRLTCEGGSRACRRRKSISRDQPIRRAPTGHNATASSAASCRRRSGSESRSRTRPSSSWSKTSGAIKTHLPEPVQTSRSAWTYGPAASALTR